MVSRRHNTPHIDSTTRAHKPEFVVNHILANEIVAGPEAKQRPIRGSGATDLATLRFFGALKDARLLLLQLNAKILQVGNLLVVSALI